MRKWWPVLLAAIVLAGASGYSSYERRVTVNSQFCTLYTTWIKEIDKGIETISLKKAEADPVGYNTQYKFYIQLEVKLIKQSPCAIKHTPPPNVLTLASTGVLPTH